MVKRKFLTILDLLHETKTGQKFSWPIPKDARFVKHVYIQFAVC